MPSSTQANGLLCWLRCDEASGNLRDSSGRDYGAAAQGNIAYQQVGKATLGEGFAISPTDTNAVAIIQTSNDIYWNALCPTVSAQAWVLFDGKNFGAMWGTLHAIAYKSSAVGDTYGWFFGVLPGGGNVISFRVMDAATSQYTASFAETDITATHHYVGTFDGAYVRLYRDGAKVAETFVSGTIGHSPTYLVRICEGIEARVDDIAIWNRALTDMEVAQLYGDATFIRKVAGYRLGDFFMPAIPTYELNDGDFYPFTLTIGPFAETVRIVSGNNLGGDPMNSPTDQWVINNANWTAPAWTSSHVIPVGTLITTLTPGQTMTVKLRAKYYYDNTYGYGSITAFAATAAAAGLDIVLPVAAAHADDINIGQSAGPDSYPQYMADGFIDPIDTRPVAINQNAVSGDFDAATSESADLFITVGVIQSFPVNENILINPLPAVGTVTADALHLLTLTGSAGATNIPYVDLYWQVEIDGQGMLTIPSNDAWVPYTLKDRATFTRTFQLPMGTFLNGKRIRLVAEANGPGASEQAVRYFSEWTTLNSPNFDFPFPSGGEIYNGAQIRNLTNQTLVVEWLYEPTGALASAVIPRQPTFYADVRLPNGSSAETMLPRTWTLAKTGKIAVYWNGQWWSGTTLPPFAHPG